MRPRPGAIVKYVYIFSILYGQPRCAYGTPGLKHRAFSIPRVAWEERLWTRCARGAYTSGPWLRNLHSRSCDGFAKGVLVFMLVQNLLHAGTRPPATIWRAAEPRLGNAPSSRGANNAGAPGGRR